MGLFANEPGTTYVIKGEPSATDTALLRNTLTKRQKANLRAIMQGRLRAFQPNTDPHPNG